MRYRVGARLSRGMERVREFVDVEAADADEAAKLARPKFGIKFSDWKLHAIDSMLPAPAEKPDASRATLSAKKERAA